MLPSKVVTYKTHHDTKKKKKPYIKMPSEKKKKKQEIKTHVLHGYNSSNYVHTETRQEENSIC